MFVVVAVGIGAILLAQHLLAGQRRKLLAGWAQQKGWSFREGKSRDVDDRYPFFKCLHRGHSRYGHNFVHGRHGPHDVMAFDYHYVTGHGKNRQTHRMSAAILTSPVPLKPLVIRPEGLLDKLGDMFGFDDIDFESAEFSRKFCVLADDRRWAYDVLHPRAMELLLQSSRHRIQFAGHEAIIWRSKRYDPAGFESAIDLLSQLLGMLPEYVVQQQLETM